MRNIRDLMIQERFHAQRLAELVQESIAEEQLLTSRLIELEQDAEVSFGQRMADKVAEFGGSWAFIAGFFATMTAWITMNVWFLGQTPFDPYPFIFLNLVLSCLAAVQAPIIMMSQNRREEKDRRRSRSDFLINLKAEMEVRNLHAKIDLPISEEMKSLFKVQQSQLDILFRIERALKHDENPAKT